MNTLLFIARRLQYGEGKQKSFTRPIITIATISVALGLAVMIVAVAVVTGFKKEIRNRIIGFGSHIQLVNFDSNNSFETKPVDKNQPYLSSIKNIQGIKHIQIFATKPGIIKTDEDIEGVVLKGVGSDYDWSFFRQNLKEGEIFIVDDSVKTNKALISKTLANLLKLKLGDSFIMFFAQQPPRARKFQITGIYETSLADFDKTFVLVDIGHVQKLNEWTTEQVSGFEIIVENFKQLDEITEKVSDEIGYDYSNPDKMLKVVSIKEKYIQIFDWLNLQDLNVWVILLLMTAVSAINMVSGLLILILDRINMIGIFKALGAENTFIRNVFLYQSGFLVAKGLFWGNLIGLLICFIQSRFGLIKLDAESYFLDKIPVHFDFWLLLVLNAGTFVVIMFTLILPSYFIARIDPAKTMKYE